MRLTRGQLNLKQAMLVVALLALVFSVPSCLGVMWRSIQDTTHYAEGYSERSSSRFYRECPRKS